MKNFLFINLFLILFNHAFAAEMDRYFCTTYDDLKKSKTIISCFDAISPRIKSEEVDSYQSPRIQLQLEDRGVQFLDADSYNREFIKYNFSLMYGKEEERGCYEKVAYSVEKFNKLQWEDEVVDNLRKVILQFKKAGICETSVKENSLYGIFSNDDLFLHFLCIANIESTFGEHNIGQGGRGIMGLSPIHDKNGFISNKKNKKNEQVDDSSICSDLVYIPRLNSGSEIKLNNAYKNDDLLLSNIKCALRLYSAFELRDWGKLNGKWGSNRFCTPRKKEAYNFVKIFGSSVCCSQECKRAANSQELNRGI